jgi:membrane-associated phospholipid phosphatase
LKKAQNKVNTFKSRVKDNPYYFYTYGILLIIGFYFLLNINKGDFVIYFNDWRGSNWDYVFKLFSSMGEGEYFGLFLLLLAIFRLKYLITGLSVYLVTGAVAQILKNIFKIPRPKVFFEGTNLVTYIKDYEIFSWNSFPSGHSTSGFAIFLFLAIITKNKKIGLVYIACAFMVAVSRVYLVQHFLIDIYFGSILGVIFTILVFNFFDNYNKINNSNWYNFSLLEKILPSLNKAEK